MTREELEKAVRPYVCDDKVLARAVIRLVVEACCEDLKTMPGTASKLPLFQSGFKHGVACAGARLKATFLPTPKEPADG